MYCLCKILDLPESQKCQTLRANFGLFFGKTRSKMANIVPHLPFLELFLNSI